jgi:phosphate butyryltransferase
MDAAILSKMAERGQIKHAIIDGPLAFDNAISPDSARHKGLTSEVAGNADVLLVPHIVTGNVIHKMLTYVAHRETGVCILGARVPAVVTSRSDPIRDRLNTIALSQVVSKALKDKRGKKL